MTRLIKNELNRIYTCKINRISVLLLIMISVIYGFLTVFQDQTITYYEQGIIYGIDAITFEKNLSHGTVGINDDEINKKLLFMGWTVIRFWGKDIKNNTDECIKVIEEAIFEMKLGENEILDAIEYDCK